MRECSVRAIQTTGSAGRILAFLPRSDTAAERLCFCRQLSDRPLHTLHLLRGGLIHTHCAACHCNRAAEQRRRLIDSHQPNRGKPVPPWRDRHELPVVLCISWSSQIPARMTAKICCGGLYIRRCSMRVSGKLSQVHYIFSTLQLIFPESERASRAFCACAFFTPNCARWSVTPCALYGLFCCCKNVSTLSSAACKDYR